MNIEDLRVEHASGDIVVDARGDRYLDLNMGYGSVCLGHGHPAVVAALQQQLARHHGPGFAGADIKDRAIESLNAFIPATHGVRAIFSTGMEAVEAALRLAFAVTGRDSIVSFESSMHGKSLLTTALSREVSQAFSGLVCRLPLPDANNEHFLLERLQRIFAERPPAAVIVEPVPMSGGGSAASSYFHDALASLCRAADVLLIFDEVLSGFYRSGSRFFFENLAFAPDIVLAGKAVGNGMPCSVLFAKKSMPADESGYRLNSTYSSHPLACAAIASTLATLGDISVERRVADIADVITSVLPGDRISGRGAMWCYRHRDPGGSTRFAERLLEKRILVSYRDGFVRLLPSYSIDRETLADACAIIRDLDLKNGS